MPCPHCTNGTVYLLTSAFPCDRCNGNVDSGNQSFGRRYSLGEYHEPRLILGTLLPAGGDPCAFSDQNQLHRKLPQGGDKPPEILRSVVVGYAASIMARYSVGDFEITVENCDEHTARKLVWDSWFVDSWWYSNLYGMAKHFQTSLDRLSNHGSYRRAPKNQGHQVVKGICDADASSVDVYEYIESLANFLMSKAGDFRNQGHGPAQRDNLTSASVTYDTGFPCRFNVKIMNDGRIHLLVETIQ